MPFTNRREFLFLYTVKDANPNGDPLNDNHPRYDEETAQALASDVRIKRTIRDEWIRQGHLVLVDGEAKSLKTRFEEVKAATNKKEAKEVIGSCIDARLFGVTFALGNVAFSWTGPVQFKWARSLNAAMFEFIQGTSAFATEGKTGDKQQRSFRNEYKVPFALMAVYGIANQYAARVTGATERDLEALVTALWNGTDNLITRSKNEHKSRFLLEVTYKEGFYGKIGGMDEKLGLVSLEGEEFDREQQKALRSLAELKLDVSPLVEAILDRKEEIEKVNVIHDGELMLVGLEALDEAPGFQMEVR
ncbi:MAG: type I-B CRISPR-associated protein Cas7/Csh2 [Syntrophothermus sp.]|uniref:type I-B CRISPR-associated protein Cas7/Csh2 n=1 Tax=Syntrophothermus sp. TaxID=2736299 RepID=UPI00257CAFC5|nr:type I-B CRISPR-associated protein Cas7/Csh2 [Syntrophothermus sp.]NSW84236.1 type I-B CRISPR-associated protein Cas7/Csh2 [Syntrophothermus sp.]